MDSSQCHGCHAAGAVHAEAAGGSSGAWRDAAAARSRTPTWRRPAVSWLAASVAAVALRGWICELADARRAPRYGSMEAARGSCRSSPSRDIPAECRPQPAIGIMMRAWDGLACVCVALCALYCTCVLTCPGTPLYHKLIYCRNSYIGIRSQLHTLLQHTPSVPVYYTVYYTVYNMNCTRGEIHG